MGALIFSMLLIGIPLLLIYYLVKKVFRVTRVIYLKTVFWVVFIIAVSVFTYIFSRVRS